jgi:ABC-type glucose/galactose transport system permease subunit
MSSGGWSRPSPWVLLNRHRLGQNAYVVGDNRHAATLMGIPIRRTRIALFVLTRPLAAFAGLDAQIVNFYRDGRLLLPTRWPPCSSAGRQSSAAAAACRYVHRGVMIGGITAGIIAGADCYTNLVYGAVILISVSIRRPAAASPMTEVD